jgi:[acyl-carrier-protein] S-malonyltransferase
LWGAELLAVVAPGQGSQSVGMLSPWVTDSKTRELVESWSSLVSVDLLKLGQSGQSEEIKSTDNAQLLIFITSILSSLNLDLKNAKDQSTIFAGHSVGEFAAYSLAGIFEVSQALKVVATRGQAMLAATNAFSKTGMSAVLGGNKDEVISYLKEFDLIPANINSNGQIIAAGTLENLDRLASTPLSGTRVRPIEVSAAFHTKYMEPAISQFKEIFNNINTNSSSQIILSNKDGEELNTPTEIISNLINQVISPVRWDLCQAKMVEMGVTGMLELAPGGTLCGIAKKEIPSVETFAIKSPEDIQSANDFIRKHIG